MLARSQDGLEGFENFMRGDWDRFPFLIIKIVIAQFDFGSTAF